MPPSAGVHTDLSGEPVLTLEPGRNCWRIEHAQRFAVAIDGEAYFAQLRDSLIRARHFIAISAWDIHSRVELVRPDRGGDAIQGPHDDLPTALGELLLALLERNEALNVFILLWDYAPIYALEREPLFFGDPPWGKNVFGDGPEHPRLHMVLDSAHPTAASQHQKIIVIDGAIAWCGGMDVSKWRWDTQAHSARDERRRDPDGNLYPPYHDVQALVDGAAAEALMALFLERWERAGGHDIRGIHGIEGTFPGDDARAPAPDPWPDAAEVLLRDVQVAIARTLPEYRGHAEVREVEQLYLDTIEHSSELLYIENQYLTSRSIADALCRSLQRESGPEILIILPQKTGHWLEQHTMDILRARVLSRFRDADRHGRLRVFYPEVPGLEEGCLMVHAKLMISDDRVLRIASSNLSNRSMGLDSECDLCVIAREGDERGEIRALRHRLLGMFLSVGPESVAESEALVGRDGHGLLAALDHVSGAHTGQAVTSGDTPAHLHLEKLDGRIDPEWDRQLPDERVVDPERPLSGALLTDALVGKENLPHMRWRILTTSGLVILLLVLVAVWRWTPVGEWLEPRVLADGIRGLNETPWGMPLGVLGFVLASLIAVPVTLLILTSSLVFGTVAGASVALVGSILSAVIGYAIGRMTGRTLVERLANHRVRRLSRQLGRRGVLTMMTVRIVPVAPFAILNLLAGSLHISLRDFVIGTSVGMLPGIIALAIFAEGLLALVSEADLRAVALVLVGILGLAGLAWLGKRLLRVNS